jgi:hypothetical protein
MTDEKKADNEEVIIEDVIQDVIDSPEVTAAPDTDAAIDKPKEVSKGQQILNKLAFEKRTEKRRADAAVAELEKLKAQQPVISAPTMPKEDEFDFDTDKYEAAKAKYDSELVDFKVQQALDNQQKREQEGQQERERQESFATFEKRVSESGIPDFYEQTARLPQFDQAVLDAIMQSENGVKIAHHLSQHLDQADIIASSNPIIAAMKIGEISQRISSATNKIKLSDAPEPIETINQGGAVKGESVDPRLEGATIA